MSRYITKNNITNFKWWIAVFIALITITALAPLFLIMVLFSLANDALSNIEDAIDSWLSKLWKRIGNWVKGEQND